MRHGAGVMAALEQYEWIYVLAVFAMITATVGIGANDGANPWATPVGSGALKLWQACLLAIVCETVGAVGGGSPVAKTIRKGIADVECFEGGENDSALLMYGAFWVLVVVGGWLLFASKNEMPVSTTHTAVCGMAGMAWFLKGSDCVVWYESGTASNWYLPGGMTGIFISWIIFPAISGLLAGSLFIGVRHFILRKSDSFQRAIKFYPVLVFVSVFIISFFMLSKGLTKRICPKKREDWLCSAGTTRAEVACGLATAIGTFAAIMTTIAVHVWIRHWAKDDVSRQEQETQAAEVGQQEEGSDDEVVVATGTGSLGPRTQSYSEVIGRRVSVTGSTTESTTTNGDGGDANADEPKLWTWFGHGNHPQLDRVLDPLMQRIQKWVNLDLGKSALESDTVAEIHEHAEVFDPATEAFFCYILIFVAICDSIAHGSNDTANGVGPFMSVNHIYNTGEVESKTDLNEDDAYGILAGGGLGIGVGVALFGWRMIRLLGFKMCKVTPSRAFAIELGAAFATVLASFKGWPVSSTHCQVVATFAVALLEGRKGLNERAAMVAGFGVISTMIMAATLAGGLASQGAYAPSVHNS